MTRIPKGAHSTANFLVIVACAVFAAAEWASPEKPVQMYCAELLTIAPPAPRAIKRRANSVEHRKVPSIAIRDLLARYTYNGDRGRVAELAACFAADGILEYPGNRAEGTRCKSPRRCPNMVRLRPGCSRASISRRGWEQ